MLQLLGCEWWNSRTKELHDSFQLILGENFTCLTLHEEGDKLFFLCFKLLSNVLIVCGWIEFILNFIT